MIRINLLPVKKTRKQRQLASHLWFLGGVLVVAALVAWGLLWHLSGQIKTKEERIAQQRQELRQLQKKIGEVNRYKELKAQLDAKLDVLKRLRAQRQGPVRLLDALCDALPEKVWLTSFEEAGGKVRLQGIGINEDSVAEFMRRLDASPEYEQVELQVTRQKSQAGLKLQEFSLTCRMQRS